MKYHKLNLGGERIQGWLEYYSTHKFSVGDYLIKKKYDNYSNTWNTELFSNNYDDVYRKYKVVHIDQWGVAYIASIIYSGTLSKYAFPLSNVDFSFERFELDPEYEIHILLGKENEYDPQAEWAHRWQKGFKELGDLIRKRDNHDKN